MLLVHVKLDGRDNQAIVNIPWLLTQAETLLPVKRSNNNVYR